MEKNKVHGYLKKFDSYKSIEDYEAAANYLIDVQGMGVDTRGGVLSCKIPSCQGLELDSVEEVIEYFFGHLKEDVDRYDLLTEKNYLDFIEDFINHKFWDLKSNNTKYFSHPEKLKFSFHYSRGDIEPYVLLDENFSEQVYGTNYNLMEVCHFTSQDGLNRLKNAIAEDEFYDISTMTVRARDFFRKESNIEVRMIGNVKAAFRSDVKSFALDSGHRSANLNRFEYPGNDKVNLCYDLASCDDDLRTGIWNEIIVTPIKILDYIAVKA